MYFLERNAKMTTTKMQSESMQTYVIDWLIDNHIFTWPQVCTVTSVRRVSMVTLLGTQVCTYPVDPVNAMATSMFACQEAAIAAVANAWSVRTTQGVRGVRHAYVVSITAELLTPAVVRVKFNFSSLNFCLDLVINYFYSRMTHVVPHVFPWHGVILFQHSFSFDFVD